MKGYQIISCIDLYTNSLTYQRLSDIIWTAG